MESSWKESAEELLEMGLEQFRHRLNDPSWEHYKTSGGEKVFKMRGSTGFATFKTTAEIDKSARTVFNFLRLNPHSPSRWGHRLANLEIKEELSDIKLVYAEIQPKPRTPIREIIFVEKGFEESGKFYVIGKSLDTTDIQPKEGHIRAQLLLNGYKVTPLGDNSCRVSYIVEIDPSGYLSDSKKEKFERNIAMELKGMFNNIY